MPRPKTLLRQETREGFTYLANHCRWWPDFWLDMFTEEQYRRLLFLRWLINEGRVHEGPETLGAGRRYRSALAGLRSGDAEERWLP